MNQSQISRSINASRTSNADADLSESDDCPRNDAQQKQTLPAIPGVLAEHRTSELVDEQPRKPSGGKNKRMDRLKSETAK